MWRWNEALSKDKVDLYTINSFLEKNIDYVLPSNSFVKNRRKLLMDGKIVTLERAYKKEKGTLILTEILDKILK